MEVIDVRAFAGMIPRTSRRLLQDSQAQIATNSRLTSGKLAALHDVVLRDNPAIPGLLSIYRIYDGANEYFLAWDKDVDAVRAPIAGDTSYRTYYTGDNEPRVTNLALATNATPYPDLFYVLGVSPPTVAPSVAHTGGTGTAISRAFCYTFVTQWGEESAPSPSSTVTAGKVDGSWDLSALQVAPLNSFSVTGASWSSSIATYTVADTRGLRVGEEVEITGITPAGYNQTGVITEVNAGNIKLALTSNPGAYSSGGTIDRVAPHNTTGWKRRIYWTETTVSGTLFHFVKEETASGSTSSVPGNSTVGEELPSSDWNMPDTVMKGVKLHSSGALVGFVGNELLFSEPYHPYAYPSDYRLTFPYDIVGIGVFGQSVLVATQGEPFVVSGVDPSTMAVTKVDQPWPCLAKRGIVSMGFGVMFPAPMGIVLIGSAGATVVTADVYTQEEFRLLKPESFVASHYAGRYIASYDPGNGQRQMMILDKAEFASVVGVNKNVTVMWTDPGTGQLYVVISDEILEWDSVESSFLIFDWMSKEFVTKRPVNMGAAFVDADFTLTPAEQEAIEAARDAIQADNQANIDSNNVRAMNGQVELGVLDIGNVDLEDLPAGATETLQFILYVEGEVKFTKVISKSHRFTLPAGYKSQHFAVRLSGTVGTINRVQLAETMKGLGAT